jgi:class 3 adenylate cyclase
MSFTITVHHTEPLPTGEYPVKLVELTTVDGKYGEQLRFKFEVVKGDYAGRTLIAFATPSGNPASKCVRWASALLERTLQAGEQVDLESLIGRYARAVVVVKSTADGREVNAVQEILPVRRAKPTPPPTENDPFE